MDSVQWKFHLLTQYDVLSYLNFPIVEMVKPLQILYRIKGDNTSKTFNNRWMYKEKVVKSYSGILTGI